MTKAYSVPKTVYSLAVMGTYLDLINQDLQPTSDPLKILYAQRIGFFPTMTVLNGREIIDRVNMDLGVSHIPLTQFLNGLIKNRLLVQAETMARNIEARYVAWYQVSRKRDKKLTDTFLNNRDSVYLPNATTLAVISKLITNTINGSYLKVTPGDGSPYDACMTEVQYEFANLCNTTGTLAPAPFSSSRFFPLLTSLLSVLKAAVDIPEEPYRYRMLPIVRIIYILCRMFNGDIKDSNYDSIFTGGNCDSGLFISDTTLAIMSGCTSDVIRTLGIHEPAPISLKGQFYLTACDGFVGDSLILDKA